MGINLFSGIPDQLCRVESRMCRHLIFLISVFSTTAFAQTKPRKNQSRALEAESQAHQRNNSSQLEYEMAVSGTIQFKNSEHSYSESTRNQKSVSRAYQVVGGIYKIFGDFEAGPVVNYYRDDYRYIYDDSSREDSSYSHILFGGGVLVKYNLADVQTDILVPFVELSYRRFLSSWLGSSSSNSVHLGFGISWFLTRNMAFTPSVKYSIESGEESSDDYSPTSKSKESLFQISWGLSNFI